MSIIWSVTQYMQQRTQSMYTATQFNETLSYLISNRLLSLNNIKTNPIYSIFLIQISLVALRFERENSIYDSIEQEWVDVSSVLSTMMMSVEVLLLLLQRQYESSIEYICSVSNNNNNNSSTGGSRNKHYEEHSSDFIDTEEMHSEEQVYGHTSGSGDSSSGDSGSSSHLEFITMYRTLYCILHSYYTVFKVTTTTSSSSCSSSSSSNTASSGSKASTTRSAIDSSIAKLVTLSIPTHYSMLLVSQCIAISLLDEQFIHLYSPEEQRGDREGAVAGEECSSSIFLEHSVAKAALSVLELVYCRRTPGSKIAIVGLASFIKYSFVLHPKVSIYTI